MSDLLPFVITGLLTGTIYGLAGSGLVLTYTTSGIFNFGHGAVLTAGGLIFYALTESHGWDWKPAMVVSVLVAGPAFGLVMELVARKLARQTTAMKVVGTVGLMVAVPAICLIAYPTSHSGLPVERFLPFSDRQRYRVTIAGVNVFGDQILVAVIAVVAVGALAALLRHSRLGAQMRAVVDDPDLLALTATNPIRVRRIAWTIGSTFACLSGVLILPAVNLHPYNLTFLATYAFGAAALGGFASISITFVGGLFVGVAADLTTFVVREAGWESLNGLPEALPFVVLFGVLIAMPRSKLSARVADPPASAVEFRGDVRLRLATGGAVLAALLAVPWLFEAELAYFVFGICQALLVLSLGLLVRTSGQMSLCHATFAAIGAVAFSQFHVEAGVPWWIAFFLAALVCVPVGAIVALPAIRLHGVYLALATLGFGILVQRLFFPQTWMFLTFAGARRVPRPFGITTTEGYYYFALGVLVLMSVVVAVVNEARIGRLLRGMSAAPTAVSTLGLSTTMTKLIVFCLSAFLAGVAGIVYGGAYTTIDSGTPPFQTFNSLLLVAVLALAPFREPWYALIAGITAVIPGLVSGGAVTHWLAASFGLVAVAVASLGGHPPMPARLRAALERRPRPTGPRYSVPPPVGPAPSGPGLEVSGLSVTFGGLRAIDDVSLGAPLGAITGLIGPNGAGKTTAFDAVSGINRSYVGRISFKGHDVSRAAPDVRGRLGLGRTFQTVQLADSLTVFDNVVLGAEAAQAGAALGRQLRAPAKQRSASIQAADAALASCGIADLRDAQAGSLSTGQRRLVELARCLAGRFDLLLLDEPSSGLDPDETRRFGELLATVVADRGCGILLVEHDMSLVMTVCSTIYVLDFGRLIFAGSPAEVAASESVRTAYLGAEALSLGIAARS